MDVGEQDNLAMFLSCKHSEFTYSAQYESTKSIIISKVENLHASKLLGNTTYGSSGSLETNIQAFLFGYSRK